MAMINLHQALASASIYQKVIIQGMLCVEYKCLDQRPRFKFWSDCSCLVYCTAGKKIYRNNNQDLFIEKGSIFFMKKGAYTGQNFLEEQYCALMFFMPDDFLSAFIAKHSQLISNASISSEDQEGIIAIPEDPVLLYFFDSVLYYLHQAHSSKELLEVKIEELMHNIFNLKNTRVLASYLSSFANSKEQNIRQLMEENYASNLKLEEYAALCNMSLSSFKRVFKQLFHESPGVWINKRKLQLASKLTLDSDKPINEIAFQCGFESDAHFNRSFKKHFGISPGKYRKSKA